MNEVIVAVLENRLVKVIRLAYPIIFWGLVLQIASIVNSSLLAFLAKLWELSLIVLLVLAFVVIITLTVFGLRETFTMIRNNREVREQIPPLIRNRLANSTSQSEALFAEKVRQLIVKTYSLQQFRLIKMMSDFSKATQTKRVQRYKILVGLSNALFFVAGASLTFEIYLLLANQIAPLFADLAFVSNSLIELSALLAIFTLVDFLEIIREQRTPFWRAYRKALKLPVPTLFRILEEFSLSTRIVAIIAGVAELIAYAGNAKFSVECPEENTLKRIMQDSIRKQLGPPLLLLYRYEDLYPPDLAPYIETLEPNIRNYFENSEQFALVGMTQNRCVLIASIYMEDVRRMTIWTDSYSLTRNIVNISTKELLNYKGSYE